MHLKRGRVLLASLIILSILYVTAATACSIPSDGLIINSSLVLCPGTYLLNDTGDGILIGNQDNSLLNCANALLRGNGTGRGLSAGNSKNLIIFGCTFDNYGTGIYLGGVNDTVITNSSFVNITSYGLSIEGSLNLTLANLTISNVSDSTNDTFNGAILLSNTNSSIISNNSITNVYKHAIFLAFGSSFNNITDNSIQTVFNMSMIQLIGEQNTVRNNRLNNMTSLGNVNLSKAYGIVAQGRNDIIRDNILTNITYNALYALGSNFTQIINNTVLSGFPFPGSESGSDIELYYALNITIANNTVTSLGINVAASSNYSTIIGNNLSNRAGLTAGGGAYGFYIANNTFYNSSLEVGGLTLTNPGSTGVIERNNFFNTSLKRFGVDEVKRSIFVQNVYAPLIIRHNIINYTQRTPAASLVAIGTAGIGYTVGLQLDDAANIVVENNTFFDMGDYAIMTGSPTGGNSVYNISFLNNTIIRGRVGVLASALNSTTFVGNIITNTTAAGVLFRLNAVGNMLINNSFSGNPIDAAAIHSSSSNTILNSSGVTTNSSAGILYVQWFGLANVSFSNGTSGNGVNVTFSNQSSILRSSAVAGSNNFTALTVLTQYYENSGAKVYEAPIISNGSRGVSTAQSNFNITGSGQVVTLVLNAIPSVPIYDGPSNASTVSSTSASLSWQNSTDVDAQPLTYIVEVSTSNSFAALTSFSVVSEGSSPTATTVSGLTNGVTYYWRVRATDGFSNSSTTAVRQFTIDTSVNPPPPPGSCFPAGTKISMADGSIKNIEDVRANDRVLGFDGKNVVTETVLQMESPVRDHLYKLVFADGSELKLTREHPLYTDDGWKALSPKDTKDENPNLIVSPLRVGDKVMNEDGSFVRLARIDYLPGRVQTYNLKRVSGQNNFFANSFLAHNKGGGSGCTDECSMSDSPTCDGRDVQECGDFDTDTCLEWRTVACGAGMVCDNGACVCEEHVVCGAWSECTNGMQERTCQDTNSCRVGPFIEDRSCGSGLEIPGLLEEEGRSGFMRCLVTQGLSEREILNLEFLMKIDACAPGYGVVDVERACGGYNVEVSGEALLSLLLDGPKPGVFVSFEPKDLGGPYCPYCFDGEQDYDEISVDCGGPSCPSCTEKPAYVIRPPISIPLAMIIALVLSLVGIYFSGKNLKKVL